MIYLAIGWLSFLAGQILERMFQSAQAKQLADQIRRQQRTIDSLAQSVQDRDCRARGITRIHNN